MLVGSGMIDGGDRVRSHHFLDTADIANVGNNRNNFKVWMLLPKLLVNLEQLAFRLIQNHESSRREAGRLAAELRSNRTRRSGNQDRVRHDALVDTVFLKPNLLTAE